MATVKLVASTYTRSNSNYVTVTNPSYMYDDTSDTSDYATIRGRAGRSSNSTYYCYLHGFNFSAVPSNATVTGFTVKIKGYRNSYQNTGSSYRVRLCGSATNSAISGTTCSSDWSTSTTTLTIPTGSLTWEQIVDYGSGFSIQLRLRNNQTSSSYYPYLYIYGAEIEVTYTVPVTYTVTASSTHPAIAVSPATQTVEEGESATVTLSGNYNVRVTDNGVNVTSSLQSRTDYDTDTVNAVLGNYTLVSGSFNSGESYFQGLVGKGVSASQTTSNYYSGGSGIIAVFTYDFSFSGIPSDANITSIYCGVSGHAESTSNDSEYMCVQLLNGSTAISEELNFKDVGTSNSTQYITATTLPAVSELNNLKLQCRLGYYGGAINGATCFVEYETGDGTLVWTYTIASVTGDHTILVSSASASLPVRVKQNGSWVTAQKVLVKQNGSWVTGTIKVKQNGNWN